MSNLIDDKRLVEIEAKLLEQEHRPTHIVYNFLTRKRWDENDPRRAASLKAVVWRLLFSPAAAATGAGLMALLTILALLHQNWLLAEQTTLARQQNAAFLRSIDGIVRPQTSFEVAVVRGETVGDNLDVELLVFNTGDTPIAVGPTAFIEDPYHAKKNPNYLMERTIVVESPGSTVVKPKDIGECKVTCKNEDAMRLVNETRSKVIPGVVSVTIHTASGSYRKSLQVLMSEVPPGELRIFPASEGQ